MENWFFLYLLTRLDGIGILCGVIAIVGSIVFGMATIMCLIEGVEDQKILLWIKRGWQVIITAGVITVIVPTKQDIFFIVGGSALIEAVHSDTAKRIGSKSLEAVETWLDENMPKKEPSK